MTGRFLKIGVPLALLALVVTAFAARTPQQMAELDALKAPTPTYSHPESRYDLPIADGQYTNANTSSRSVSLLDDRRRPANGLRASAQVSPGLVACDPGTTYDFHHNDNNQQMIATLPSGGEFTHFAWTYWSTIPDSLDALDRFVRYRAYSTSVGFFPADDCGAGIDLDQGNELARSGFPTVEVATGDKGVVAFHARDDQEQLLGSNGMYTSWVFTDAGPVTTIWDKAQLGNASSVEEGQAIWPHIDVDLLGLDNGSKSPDAIVDVFHLVSHPSTPNRNPALDNQLIYWRRLGSPPGPTWQGPVALDNNAGGLSYHVASDPTSEKCAVFYQRDNLDADQLLQNGYLESPNNGTNWISVGAGIFPTLIEPTVGPYVPITSYLGPEGDNPQSWLELQGEYDLDGIKHAVWIEQIFSNQTADCRVKHWDEINGTATIKQALNWDNVGVDGGRDLWLALPNLAFGDGSTTCTDGPGDLSNYNYVYVTYEQYGGPTPVEANDVSASDNAQNLEIYITASNDAGGTFSPSVNLTNTKTPGCDGTIPAQECASERDPSIAHVVNDTISIVYILDTDAGDAVFEQGFWTFNPVMYYRIPGGTDADILCPEIAPVFAAQLTNGDADCEYHAPTNGSQVEDLIVENFGNAPLTGVVSKVNGSAWLQMTTGGYSIVAGGAANVRTVTLNGSVASGGTNEGLYQDTIRITHDDPSQPTPHNIPVDFFVFDEFYCPEFVTLNTGWLWLEVSNVERQANQSQTDGGLSRLSTDTSYSIYDASLIIGVPPSPDTLVFRNIFGTGNGQPGFRALGNLEVDTSAYGMPNGSATAYAAQTTSDSTLGIDVTYIFPQNSDSCEFVLIKYKLTNRTGSTINGINVGQATDFDVTPSLNNADSLQPGSQNTGHLNASYNLIYQQGVDTVGHIPTPSRSATVFKGGITAIQGFQAPRAWIAPNDPWLFGRTANNGGFSEGYLYDEMTGSGFELFPPNDPDPEEDLHGVMVMEQNVSLGPNDVKHYLIGYVSSNTGLNDDDLIETTRKAWRYCFGWWEFVEEDAMDDPAATSYPYYAIGSHEDGLGGGCYGCQVDKVSGDPEITVTPGGDPCFGTVDFSGGVDDAQYTATIRVRDLCGDNSDECIITITVGNPPTCECPYQGDLVPDSIPDAQDLNGIIDVLFFGSPLITDPLCPAPRADMNWDGVPDAQDLNYMIDRLFFGGPAACDPCNPSGPNCLGP